jgi:NDP-sugar pyrophosphorylase family protein
MSSDLFPVAILAGGLATRLRPVTERIPKALIDINGEPFIAHQLRLLKSKRIERVVLCVGYLGELVRDFVGDASRFGLKVEYSFDGLNLLGTGGAIKRALPLLGETFFVMYGDSYLNCNFQDIQNFFHQSQCDALMTVFHNAGRFDKSNLEFLQGRIMNYDKANPTAAMQYIDYGLSILRRRHFDSFPDGQPFQLENVLSSLQKSGQLGGLEVFERFFEVGSFEGISDLRQCLAAKTFSTEIRPPL